MSERENGRKDLWYNFKMETSFWSTQTKIKKLPPLKRKIEGKHVIIGGGIMGLMCALRLHELGEKDIIILEKDFCGSGASGLSAGFITAESELTFSNVKKMFGEEIAHKIFDFSNGGAKYIQKIIEKENISCNYHQQDCVVVAENESELRDIIEQAEDKKRAGQESIVYSKEKLNKILSNSNYIGALRYGGTFGINPLKFCLALRDKLIRKGVQIFESTIVTEINPHKVIANEKEVKSDFIYSCLDKFTPDLSLASSEIHRMRTTVMVSQPLDEIHLKNLFPLGNFLFWDSKLIYRYFRILDDNRLLFGGSTLWETYWGNPPSQRVCENDLLNWAKEHMQLNFIPIHSCWSGEIGISRNLLPYLEKNDHLYICGGSGGLPWASAMGIYLAESSINHRNDLDKIFARRRTNILEFLLNKMVGKSTSFAYSNWKSMH